MLTLEIIYYYLQCLIPRFSSGWIVFEFVPDGKGNLVPQPICKLEDLEEDDEPDAVAYMKSFCWLGNMIGRVDHSKFIDWEEFQAKLKELEE